jgi:2-oxo-3-hexenedioate decarboxylase
MALTLCGYPPNGTYEVATMIDPNSRHAGAATERIAEEVLSALASNRQIEPFTGTPEGLDLRDAYRVTAAVRRMREAKGERVVGQKAGFTNRTIWDEYAVYAPIWGYVYDTTLHRLEGLGGAFDLSPLVEPRIEPEIVFGLGRSPEFGMDERALLHCIDWVAHGFEVVQSLFPGWRFQAADTVAAFGLHGALLLGVQEIVRPAEAELWNERLRKFEVTLVRDGVNSDHGYAANVLGGGPLAALRHLVEVLAEDPDSPPLQAGEIVSTGTLTKALPVSSGQTWATSIVGLPLPGISVTSA